jgi:phosphoribosylanthranilate isomerase
MVRVKICGITCLVDAVRAAEAGAHALGFVFYRQSPRWVPLSTASRICASLPPFISKVGVFVNATEKEILRVIEECGLDVVQLHGEEPPAFCRRFPTRVIKAFRIRDADDLRTLARYRADGYLLDTFLERARGGTGRTFNWSLAIEAKRRGRRIILAGGLTPGNVAEAIRKVHPFGVDVSSGVETSPGRKSPAKIIAFLKACGIQQDVRP